MSDLGTTTPPMRGTVARFGVDDAIPLVERGNSVVFAAPPSAAYSVPLIAAALGRADTEGRPHLLIAPDAAWSPWVDAGSRAADLAGKRAAAGPTPARTRHHLKNGKIDLIVTSLAVAGQLLKDSALEMPAVATIILAWPELEADPDGFVTLFADVPKETPRVILTADPVESAPLAERYAWRAPLVGSLGTLSELAPLRFPTAATGWPARIPTLAALADLLDRDALVVWTVDDLDHPAIAAALAAHGVTVTFATGTPLERTPAWFYDAPPAAILESADPMGSVLLVPPGVESYVARFIKRPDPIKLPSPADVAGQAITADRRAIRAMVEAGPDRAAFATVAPLLDQYSATDVAVALQALWLAARTRAAAPAAAPPVDDRRTKANRVWAGAGKKDSVTLADWMALLTGTDVKMPRAVIGKVEIRDTFTVIEFTTDEAAKAAADRLAGQTIRRRRITARVDRGREGRRPA